MTGPPPADRRPEEVRHSELVVDRHVLIPVLGALAAVLVVLGTVGAFVVERDVPLVVESLGSLLLLGAEAVVPSWFASTLLLLCALALPLAAAALPQLRARFLVLALVFVGLSMDEAAVVHERATGALLSLTTGSSEGDQPVWVLVALPLVGLVGWYLLPVVRGLPKPVAVRWWAAVAAFLGGAVGVEVLHDVVGAQEGTAYYLSVALEEGLELLGVLIFLDALLLLAAGGRRLRLSWQRGVC